MRKTVVFVAIAILAGITVFFVIARPQLPERSASAQPGQTITDQTEINSRAIGFAQTPYRDDYGNLRVAGYVDNLGSTTLIKVQTTIELRDRDGGKQDEIEHVVTDIPPGQREWFDLDAGRFEDSREAYIVITSIEVAQ